MNVSNTHDNVSYLGAAQKARSTPQSSNNTTTTATGPTETVADKSTISDEAKKMLAELKAAADNDVNAKNKTKEASAREAWMPDRLEPLEPFTVLSSIGMTNEPIAGIPTTMDPSIILSLQNSDKWETIPSDSYLEPPSPKPITSASPEWYEDLAYIKNKEQSEDIMNEYYGYLKEAMNEALDEANIPAASEKIVDGMRHHEALIVNQESSKQIQQSVMEKLAENPRATELMNMLGIE